MVRVTLIYTKSGMLLSKKEVASWRQIQEEYDDFVTSLGPWTREEAEDYLTSEYPNLEPAASEQIDALLAGTAETWVLRFAPDSEWVAVAMGFLSRLGIEDYEVEHDSILVPSPGQGGFPVELRRVGPGGFQVSLDGWHEEFPDSKEALSCFEFAFSERCRLAVYYRGNAPTKWVVQSLRNGEWVSDSETGLLFVPFWRERRIVYLSNGRKVDTSPDPGVGGQRVEG